MFFADEIVKQVDEVARIFYVDHHITRSWNENRRGNELRLLTGWCWASRSGSEYRQGFKTRSVAYRDAFYTLIRHSNAPGMGRSPKVKLQVVSGKKVA